ncbi:hypothetical protein NF27_GQ00010, partial [Candidatus Jidaibacter acanthamoeba]
EINNGVIISKALINMAGISDDSYIQTGNGLKPGKHEITIANIIFRNKCQVNNFCSFYEKNYPGSILRQSLEWEFKSIISMKFEM